jgi:Protein of unknown function (DUF1592)/Protein of unknown function (DUF1588)/Protein of unknown function (DUF1595)/Protein of unknown function (DUF1585)/Protein of unknown function (DUF1587)
MALTSSPENRVRFARASAFVIALGILAAASCSSGQIGDQPRIIVRGSPTSTSSTTDSTGSSGTGSAGAGDGSGTTTTGTGGAGSGVMPAIGPGNMRRLTRSQVQNSLTDLLLGAVELGTVQPDSVAEGFASVGATYVAINDTAVEQYHATFKAALSTVFADATRRGRIVGCTPSGLADMTCLKSFVTAFGRLAWRRPLTDAEISLHAQVGVTAGQALGDATKGLVYTTLGLLDSPNFLYRIEIGTPDAAAGGRYRYSGYETASRLSFFLWNTTPDDALLTAAQDGKLDGPDGIGAEVARLLVSPRAKDGIGNYARELFALDTFEDKTGADPRYTATLRQAMSLELTNLFQSRLEVGADALDLLDTTKTFVNAELAALYGIQGVTGTALVPVTLPANIPRAGILGTGVFLAQTSKLDVGETSPTARGVFINEQILCRDIPPPPDNVDTTLHPKPDMPQTKRQMLEDHRKNPMCAACHGAFDPLGFAFENFDWIGANRAAEPSGLPVDTKGSFEGTDFANSRDLVQHIRSMPEVERCFLNHVFRYAMGHKETPGDERTLVAWKDRFASVNHQLPELVKAVTITSDFAHVSVAP